MNALGFVSLVLCGQHFEVRVHRGSETVVVPLPKSTGIPVVSVLNNELDFVVAGEFQGSHGLKPGEAFYFQGSGRTSTAIAPPNGSRILASTSSGFIIVSFVGQRAEQDVVLGTWDQRTGVEVSLHRYNTFNELAADAMFGNSVQLSEKGFKPFSPFHLIGVNGNWFSQEFGLLSYTHGGRTLTLRDEEISLKPGTVVNFITGNSRMAGVSITKASTKHPLNHYWGPMSRMIEFHQSEWMAVMILDLKTMKVERFLNNTFAAYFPDEYSVIDLVNRRLSN